jgi:hypothetical protein
MQVYNTISVDKLFLVIAILTNSSMSFRNGRFECTVSNFNVHILLENKKSHTLTIDFAITFINRMFNFSM